VKIEAVKKGEQPGDHEGGKTKKGQKKQWNGHENECGGVKKGLLSKGDRT